MTKSLLERVMDTLVSVIPGPLGSLAATIGAFIATLDIPEDDDRWRKVAGGVEDVLTRIVEASDEPHGKQVEVRLAAEREFHRLLREHGLIERG